MSAARRRGQPLAMLGVVLAGWIGVRAAVWEPPFALPRLIASAAPIERAPGPAAKAQPVSASIGDLATSSPAPAALAATAPVTEVREAAHEALMPLARAAPTSLALAPLSPPPLAVPATTGRVAAAHQLLYLAALGQLPLPPGLGLAASQRPAPPPLLAAAGTPRWSGDAWVLVRRGSAGLAAASGFATYGASQAGGVLRFALAPGSQRAPQAYLRLSRAIGGFDEGEVAVGLSARPFASVPLRLLGEARVQRGAGFTRVRPAASLVSEVPPVRLPLGVEGEAYAQAGYVGGKQATPFFDVQAVANRRLASAGPAELRLGAGLWSGGQKGAARLDLGPRASLRVATGAAASRLALDWRFRVAGNARPASGPTLTFSAGF